MDEIADYYVTLKPIREGGVSPIGMKNIAYVSDPAVEEMGIFLSVHDKRIVVDNAVHERIINYLKTVGQILPLHWKQVSEEEFFEAQQIHLSNDPTSAESFNDLSKRDGSGQWLVRYIYTGPQDERNRSFCSEILSLNRIYTQEEIENGLSNPEFGNYSIFDYKGSYGCRHRWKRQIYFEDFEDDVVRRVGFVPQVTARLNDREATTLNAFLSKDEKMQVVAPLLIPEKKIFRSDEIGRYNMIFTNDTIRDIRDLALSRNIFDKEDLFKDTHVGGVAPSYVLDEWITESADDKSYTEYKFDISRHPIGTWFVLSQITDRNYWENEIKLNKKYAYSIEALMNLSIIQLSKTEMEKDQIVLPDGEHLISGTIYVVKDGAVIEKKEVTPEQEEVIEEVAESTIEEMGEKPTEEVKEVMEETPVVVEEKPVDEGNDRIAKLEAAQEELMGEIAKLKSEMEKPLEEETPVLMSDNRQMWKRVSDSINALKNKK